MSTAAPEHGPAPLVLTVFGASGDLTERKLLPALAALASTKALPDSFVLVGVSRRAMSDEQFRAYCMSAATDDPSGTWAKHVSRFRYLAGDSKDPATFDRLADLYRDIDATCATRGNRVHYLATAPALFATIAAGLAGVGANAGASAEGFARIVVEKPFGVDLASAQELDRALHESFAENQIFRIDHYMGKETVQNVLALRFANSIFEPVWNRRYVDHIQITVAEEIGIEQRGEFYESAGALRDMVQNHVMQVLALMLMEPPGKLDAGAIRDEKVKLLRAVVPGTARSVPDYVVRGQYLGGIVAGEEVPGYREEGGVAPNSLVETFIAMRLQVDNWRWAGVPVFVRTGKRLARRVTEVAIVFQRPPHLPFGRSLAEDLGPDALIVRIQPDEGISLCFGAKVPGPSFVLRSVAMDFTYRNAFVDSPGDAYERLLLDAMIGDPTLFIRADEVEVAWSIVAPVQDAFASGEILLAPYAAGGWGPVESERLLEATGRAWMNP